MFSSLDIDTAALTLGNVYFCRTVQVGAWDWVDLFWDLTDLLLSLRKLLLSFNKSYLKVGKYHLGSAGVQMENGRSKVGFGDSGESVGRP